LSLDLPSGDAVAVDEIQCASPLTSGMESENTEFGEETSFPQSDLLPNAVLRLLPDAFLFILLWTITIAVRLVRKENEALLRRHREMKCLMSIDDVADVLGVSRRTMEDIVASGDLDPIWIKGQRRFHPDAVDAYLRRQAKDNK
jgi:excisionase family DNA binding protein